jgi:hypothetical protein
MNTRMLRWLTIPCLIALAAGCVSKKKSGGSYAAGYNMAEYMAPAAAAADAAQSRSRTAPQDRMLVWKARLGVDVWNISNAVVQAEAIAAQNGGYVEYKSDDQDGYSSLKLRIPVQAFTQAVHSVESLGEITSRYVENEDVTEQYVDLDARLKNRIVLRDRLRDLLGKAIEVKDILAIETELNRVQGDIDSMEARRKALQGQVDFATVDLSLHRKEILGPLGYALKGVWWTISKLFVLRD